MTLFVTFNNVHEALESEQMLKKDSELSGRLVPVPESIDASCGLALKLEQANGAAIKDQLSANDLSWQAIYQMVSYQDYRKL